MSSKFFFAMTAIAALLMLSPSFVHSEPYTDKGTASWFGHWHHGKTTASGEPFDMYAMTAAHRTLPFGTVIQVTNTTNGREILVRINDRGPYRKKRILDLSLGAAEKLDMRQSGLASVVIEQVGDKSGLPLEPGKAFFVRLDMNGKQDGQDPASVLPGLVRVGFHEAVDMLHMAAGASALGPFDTFDAAHSALSRIATLYPEASIMLAGKEEVEAVVSIQAVKEEVR